MVRINVDEFGYGRRRQKSISTSSIPHNNLEIIENNTFRHNKGCDTKMQTLNFTLTPEGVIRVHDAVLCLAKFSEVVGFEAHRDKVGHLILLDFMSISPCRD